MTISFIVLLAILGQPSSVAPSTTLALSSDAPAGTIAPCTVATWTIDAFVDESRNRGLAGISVDLVQSASNPQLIDTPPATGVPTEMLNFSRPYGICNPAPGGGSAYGGTQAGPGGSRNLLEIGGMQNTFGVSVAGFGTNTSVVQGLGQGATPQIIATGAIEAPNVAGTYEFYLEHGDATVLTVVRSAPQPTSVIRADVVLMGSVIFTVRCLADFNNTGGTPDDADVAAFVTAWNSGSESADVNCSGGTPDDADLALFFSRWSDGC